MARLQLTGGAYQARSVIASAQSMVNLYAEPMPKDAGEPAAYAYYPTPGLTLLGTAPQGPFRGGLTCTNSQTYAVFGNGVYILDLNTPGVLASGVAFIHLGDIAGPGAGLTTPVGMSQNSNNLVIVDGTSVGWQVNISLGILLVQIVDPNFLGATNIDYVDTFFVSNVPSTGQFQAGDSVAVTWNPLFVAAKVSYADVLQTLIVAKREIWLIGVRTSEVWYNTGASDFPFEEMQGVFIDHGTPAPYSVAEIDNAVYWLSQDRRGQGYVLRGSGYKTDRISTYALEEEFATYFKTGTGHISDAEGYTFQLGGHQFYVLSFPGQDKTWAYDISTGLWHRWMFTDLTGDHRHRARQIFPAFPDAGACLIAGDWQNGNVYLVDLTAFTDAGFPIKRQRAFPHLLNDGNRQFYWQFIADMEVGDAPPGATDTLVSLDWSDDRGQTFGTPVTQSIGAAGQFLTSMQWQRLGMARDRVFRLTWTCPFKTALQGVWLEVEPSEG